MGAAAHLTHLSPQPRDLGRVTFIYRPGSRDSEESPRSRRGVSQAGVLPRAPSSPRNATSQGPEGQPGGFRVWHPESSAEKTGSPQEAPLRVPCGNTRWGDSP